MHSYIYVMLIHLRYGVYILSVEVQQTQALVLTLYVQHTVDKETSS